MVTLVDRHVTVKNYLDRMPRIPAIPGHPWESVESYSLAEMQRVEAMLKSELTHLHEGLTARSLQMPYDVASRRKSLLTDQLSALRAIRRIMYPLGTIPKHKNPTDVSSKLWRYSNHLARMFHRYAQDETDENWTAVLDAYARIPHELLEFTPNNAEDSTQEDRS